MDEGSSTLSDLEPSLHSSNVFLYVRSTSVINTYYSDVDALPSEISPVISNSERPERPANVSNITSSRFVKIRGSA